MILHPDVKALIGSSRGWASKLNKLDRQWTDDDLPPFVKMGWVLPSVSYADGFAVGVEWTKSWIPGGPYDGGLRDRYAPSLMETLYDANRKLVCSEWLRGWRAGREEQERRKQVGWEPSASQAA